MCGSVLSFGLLLTLVLNIEWEMIDKIKASEEPSVVVNIFRVHPEATWKEIKEVYKDISMKIEKVPNKEGIFNLLFRNHNDAIEFIRVSPKVPNIYI